MLRFIQKKLSRKILIILTIFLALPMVVLTYFSASRQARNMIVEMTQFGDELAHAVYSGIKYPMSIGDSGAVRGQLLELREKLTGIDVFITDPDQRIIYTTRGEDIGSRADGTTYNQEHWRRLRNELPGSQDLKITFEDTIQDKKYLTTVRLVRNQVECHGCHGAEKNILGSIVVRMSTDSTYQAIAMEINHNLFIGVLGILIVLALTYVMIYSQVNMPMKMLANDMEELPYKIASGDFIDISNNREDEIGQLKESFNQMAMDLKEKQGIIDLANRELTEANKELEAFAYSVSHDLRAPLRNIDGFSKILLDEYRDQLDDTGHHYLNRVRNGTTKMSRLIDDMLAFSRAGRVEIKLLSVDTNNLLNEIIRDFSEEIKEQDITVKIRELPKILCDPLMIRNVFSNLISNAIKYTRDSKHPELIIDFDRSHKALTFKDNGIGFDMKFHDKIFQVFQRLQLPEDYPGTGIGLAIAKKIVDRHHGAIWAEAELDKGTTFFVKIPLDE